MSASLHTCIHPHRCTHTMMQIRYKKHKHACTHIHTHPAAVPLVVHQHFLAPLLSESANIIYIHVWQHLLLLWEDWRVVPVVGVVTRVELRVCACDVCVCTQTFVCACSREGCPNSLCVRVCRAAHAARVCACVCARALDWVFAAATTSAPTVAVYLEVWRSKCAHGGVL